MKDMPIKDTRFEFGITIELSLDLSKHGVNSLVNEHLINCIYQGDFVESSSQQYRVDKLYTCLAG